MRTKTQNRKLPYNLVQVEAAFLAARSNSSPRLILIRGIPGSGKSTLAKKFVIEGYKHIETDMYFTVLGRYVFKKSQLSQAHAWCLNATKYVLNNGGNAVVSNTFCKHCELVPFQQLTESHIIIESIGNWTNHHGVANSMVENMKDRWE